MGRLFFLAASGKMVYGVPTSEKNNTKNSDSGTILSGSGSNIFFFSEESLQFLMMDV